MSTVIAGGFRIKTRRTQEFLLKAHDVTLAEFSKWLDDLGTPNLEKRGLPPEVAKMEPNELINARLNWLEDQFVAAYPTQDNTNEAFFVESGYNLFNCKDGYTYGWDWGRFTKEAWEIVDFAEDFSYQNQSDRPEEFTERQWRARGKKWDEVALDNFTAVRMSVNIISFAPGAYHTRNWMAWTYRKQKFLELGIPWNY